MANVMSFKNVKNKPHRSAFDLSYKNAFTAKIGELIPCFVKEVLPGDSFHLNPSHFTRTSPVNTAAYTRIRENVDFFFVPYRLLWDKWTQFIAQTNDPHYAASATSPASAQSSIPFCSAKDLFNAVKIIQKHDGNSTDFAYLDASLRVAYPQTIKLLQALGYGALIYPLSVPNGPGVVDNTAISLFRAAAYQKIYYDNYRNSQWELSKPQCYNFDYMFSDAQLHYRPDTFLSNISAGMPFDSMFTLRYANYSKDLTMGLNPSPQFGDTAIAGPLIGNGVLSFGPLGVRLSTFSSSGPGTGNFVIGRTSSDGSLVRFGTDSTNLNPIDGDSFVYTELSNGTGPGPISIPASAQSGISVLSIRLAESLQKYREITLTGSKDYKDQIEKHWGVRVPDYASDMCQRVYSYDSMVEISEVMNQSLNDGAAADIKGRGVSAGSGGFTWKNTSNDYGILMGIYHAEPLLDYQSDLFLERHLTNVLPSSFPIPELDSIGMESVPKYCVAIASSSTVNILDNGSAGYAPRYFEFKTSRDVVNGGFCWYGQPNDSAFGASFNGGFANWVSAFGKGFQRRLNSTVVDYQTFKISPELFNSIFVAQVSPSYNRIGQSGYPSFEDDQLLIKAFFDCKVIRNLSYDGLPY